MQTQPQIKKRVMMTQVAEQLETQLEVQATGRVQCDSCSARAMIVSILPYGELSFCMHHYNQHAQALTDQGGIAKLLSVNEDQIGNHMNFGKGGQNIVQAGSNNPSMLRSAGGILDRFLGTKLRRQERDYNREKDYAARKDFKDYEIKANTKGKVIEDMVRPAAAATGARQAYDIAMEVHPEGHPNAGKFVNEEMANQVKRYGFDVGYRPAKTPASISQVEMWQQYRDSDPKVDSKTSTEDYSGTVARFGKDGKMTREKVSLEDIEFGEKTSETAPDSMRNFDDSSRPSNQTFTDQQKADLEKERPRTNNLNTGINESKGGNN